MKLSFATDSIAQNNIFDWCWQCYGKNGSVCFTGTLYTATHGRFLKYDNCSVSVKIKQTWKELGVCTDGIVSPCMVPAPSAKE